MVPETTRNSRASAECNTDKGLTLNHDTQVRPAEGAVGVLSHLDLALRVDEEHSWLWEGVLSLPDVAWVTDVQPPPAHVCQLEAVGNAVGDLLGLCGCTQAVQLHHSKPGLKQTASSQFSDMYGHLCINVNQYSSALV